MPDWLRLVLAAGYLLTWGGMAGHAIGGREAHDRGFPRYRVKFTVLAFAVWSVWPCWLLWLEWSGRRRGGAE